MANNRVIVPLGERNKITRPSEYVHEPSTIDPIPYFPNIAKQLRGPTNALVLTYIEMCHPAPQDANGTYLNESVTISCDDAARDLQISRRTLYISLHCLATWFLTEDARGRAERVGRAFLNTAHSYHGSVKCFSIVGPQVFSVPGITLKIKRNWARINAILIAANLNDLIYQHLPQHSQPNHLTAKRAVCAPLRSLLSCLPEWGDRRAERWDRWRRENGRKSQNPGRMRDAKKSVSSTDQPASGDIYIDTDGVKVEIEP